MGASTQPDAPETSERAAPRTFLWAALALSLGHTASDFYSNFATVQLDNLKHYLDLSEIVAASLPVPMIVLGSLAQPLFGIVGDVWGRRRLQAALGIGSSALFVGLMGMATSGLQVLVLLALGGIGVGWFHPNAAALMRRTVPARHGFAVSMFLGGGVIGLLLSPVMARQFYQLGDWASVVCAAVPGVLIALAVFLAAPAVEDHRERSKVRHVLGHLTGPLKHVFAFATVRAFAFTAPLYYMPFYGRHAGWTSGQITLAQTIWFLGSAAGNFLGMYVADRHHWRAVLNWSCLLSGVLLFAAYFCGRPGLLALGFFAYVASSVALPSTVIVAQRAAPGGASFSSAMVMGAAWGLSGVLLPVLAWLAHHTSYTFALQLMAPTMIVSAFLARPLIKSDRLLSGEPPEQA